MSSRLFASLVGKTLDAAKKERTDDKETQDKRERIRSRTSNREVNEKPFEKYSPPVFESTSLDGFYKTKTEPSIFYMPRKVKVDGVKREEDVEMTDVNDDVVEVESGEQKVGR